MTFLKNHKKAQTIATIFYAVGGIVTIAGIYNLYQDTKKDSETPFTKDQARKAERIIFLGAGTVGIGAIIPLISGNNIKRAIEAYNE